MSGHDKILKQIYQCDRHGSFAGGRLCHRWTTSFATLCEPAALYEYTGRMSDDSSKNLFAAFY